MYTSLFRDKTYNQFWNSWQAISNTFLPFIALGTINGKTLWNLAKSNKKWCRIESKHGLRIHVGWVYEINKINQISTKIYCLLGLQGKAKRKDHLLFCLLWWLHSWSVTCFNLLLIFSGPLTQLLCNKFHSVLRWTSNILFIFTAAFWLS